MRSVFVLDGRFRVTDQGEVFRQKNGGEYPASISFVSRSRNIPVVSYADGGRPIVVYLSRLIADAFIPNPNGLPLVLHLDGNPCNNSVENLIRGTNSDRMRLQYDSGKMDRPCKICGTNTRNRTHICNGCKAVRDEISAERHRKAKIASRRAYASAMMNGAPTRGIGPRDREILSSFASGLTLADIARQHNLTRERVRQIVLHGCG